MRMLALSLLFACFACGCTTYYGSVVSINEADETVAEVESHSFAKKIVSMLDSLPARNEQAGAVDLGMDHTIRVMIDEPGQSGQMIIRGKAREKSTSGFIRRMVRARIRNDVTEVYWISGWGERTGRRDFRQTTPELAEEILNVGEYTSVYGNKSTEGVAAP